MISKITFAKYETKHKEGTIDFLKLLLEELNSEERKKYFESKYEKTPYLDSPLIYLAMYGDKIIAFRGFILQKFKLKEDIVLVCSPSDATVAPDYRRLGIFSRLTLFALEDINKNTACKLCLNLSSNKQSTAGYIKLEWVPMGKKGYLYRIFPNNFIKNKIGNTASKLPLEIHLKKNINIEITNQLKPYDISSLMSVSSRKEVLSNVRDVAFYKWKFNDVLSDITYVYCKKDGELVGYLALKSGANNWSSLIEYGYTDHKYFFNMIQTAVKALSVNVLRVHSLTLDKNERKIFFKAGFINEKGRVAKIFKKERLPALIRPTVPSPEEKDFYVNGLDVRKVSNWQLFISDID